jgi:hypothetical protein
MKSSAKLIVTRSTSAFATLACLTFSTFGCAEPDASGNTSAALTNDGWTWCAVQGDLCAFEGVKQVQFGAGAQFVTANFSGGVHCDNGDFNVKFGGGNACYVKLVDETQPAHVHSATSATDDAGVAHEHASTEDAGVTSGETAHIHAATSDDAAASATTVEPTHDHTAVTAPATTPTTVDPNQVHDMTAMTAAGMPGPYINKAAIPLGSPGVGVLEVRPTTEQPKANNDVGAFRTSCAFSHMNNDDPIVFPGQPGRAHLHSFFGNTGTNAASTADSLKNSGNSTCRGGIANRSGYWVPAVVQKNGTPLKPTSAQVYYKTGYNGIAPAAIKVFPEGLRMIAGDAKSSTAAQEHAFWSCEVYNGHPRSIPDCPTGQKVVMQVFFPQCWNGKDLDSADHKSHMAYPVNGACPATHPVSIPEISFNIYYEVPAGTRSSEWHLSSDMYDQSQPGGYSAHGDWFEGWQRDIAEAFVKNCDNTQSDCHSHLLGDGREIYSSLEGV